MQSIRKVCSRIHYLRLLVFLLHVCRYAKSLDATKFSRPPARTGGGRGTQHGGGRAAGRGRGGGSGSGGARGKAQAGLSKAEQIRLENAERRAAKGGGSASEQWAVVRKRLEAATVKAGWSREVAGEAAAVLSSLAAKSAAVYLEAATWRVAQLSQAWEGATRPPRGTGSLLSNVVSDSSTGAVPALQEGSHPATALAVDLWAAVADILQRGLLQPGSGAPEEARLEAAAACRRALKLLGLAASAEHVAAVASAAEGSGKDSGSKGKRSSSSSSKSSSKAGGGSSKVDSRSAAAEVGLGLSDARFQLHHCGPLLPHEAPPERDARVQSFNPDPWQRQVGGACRRAWECRGDDAASSCCCCCCCPGAAKQRRHRIQLRSSARPPCHGWRPSHLPPCFTHCAAFNLCRCWTL